MFPVNIGLRFKAIKRISLTIFFVLTFAITLLFAPMGLSVDPVDVLLDGQVLFQVKDTPSGTAEERSEKITQQIQQVLDQEVPISVEVKGENVGETPTIVLNDKILLQIYPSDVTDDRTVQEQSFVWAEILRTELGAARQQRSNRYLRNAIIISVGLIIAAGILHVLMGRFWFYPARWLLRQLGTIESLTEPLTSNIQMSLKVALALAQAGIWVTVALVITSLFPLTRSWSTLIRQGLWTGLTEPFVTLGNQSYSLKDVFVLLIMVLALLLLIGALINFLKQKVLPRVGLNRGATEIVALVIRYILITLGIIVLLQIWGLNLSSLTILGSALGVGIGFGLQGIAKNFISGLVLLFERSVQVGDLIEVGDHIGVVERVSARNLIVKTLDRVSIIVPSSKILEDFVVNWTHEGATSRLHVAIGVAYGTELNIVKKLLLQVAEAHRKVLRHPKPEVVFIGFGESSLNFELLVWVNQPSQQLFIRSDLYFDIDAIFRQNRIEIPFPQRDLHIRTLPVNTSMTSSLTQLPIERDNC